MEQLVVGHPIDRGLLLVEVLQQTGLGFVFGTTDERMDVLNASEGFLQQQ